jgi:hypothetical protein
MENPVERWKTPARRRSLGSSAVHLRPPSLDHGFVSGLWAIGLGLFLLLGQLAIGIGKGTAFIVAGLAAALIYFYVRLYGEDRPGPRA